MRKIEPFIVREDWADECVIVQCPCGNRATVMFDSSGDEEESECEECHRVYTASVSFSVYVEHNGELVTSEQDSTP